MSLILSLGTNIGDREKNLADALKGIEKKFPILHISRVYESKAVDYFNQPDFFNIVIECTNPISLSNEEIMDEILNLELELGRKRDIPKGPRIIDIDILFRGLEIDNSAKSTIPHPRLFDRSFVVLPLQELPYYSILKSKFEFKDSFSNSATPKYKI